MMRNLIWIALFIGLLSENTYSQRKMENLGRGTVAVRANASQVFISWRILGTEFNNGTTYNLYRGATKIASNLAVSNYTDNISTNDTYNVTAIYKGIEQPVSPAVSVSSTPYLQIPLQSIGDCYVHLAWVGDLDGDGEFDFVVDRIPNVADLTPKVEAYKRDGTFLWRVDMGPLSLNADGIEGGAAAISNGMWDGVTVYDMNNDGKAEVILKTAKGTILGDGTVVTHTDDIGNFVSVLNGLTGAELARIQLPTDYLADGPLGTQFNIAYLNGINPSIVVKAKNRIGSGAFNLVVAAYDYKNGSLTQRWQFKPGGLNCPEYHQQRIADVDGDGKDEVIDGGYALDDNGTLLYSLGNKGIVHGDRFQIGDFDPSHPGLEGYGIQQDNPSGLAWYYYDAKDGKILQSQYLPYIGDYARGNVADLDPRFPGFEMWTFTDGLYNVSGKKASTAIPASYPNFRLWWDGDLLSEMLDGLKFNKWNYTGSYESRMMTASDYGATKTWREAPVLYGDILGDWREEVVYEHYDHSKLLIFTTTVPTSNRIYTLAHNPEYRLCMTTKGYYQSAQTDFYLGYGMATPPIPAMQSAKCTWKGGQMGNVWDESALNWIVSDTLGKYTHNDDVMFDITGGSDTLVDLSGSISPSSIKVISPQNYTFKGTGKITGSTGLIKAGYGTLNINTDCDYTDTTRIEQGIVNINSNLSQSPVIVNFGATLGGTDTISKPVFLHKGAIIAPGKLFSTGNLTFISGLTLSSQSSCIFDITDDSTSTLKPSDKIIIAGDIKITDTAFFKINKINSKVKAGVYPLITYTGSFTGNLKKINISGLFGQKFSLKDSINTIWLEVIASRNVGKITWSGAGSEWDLLTSPNWLLNGLPDIFANSDSVVFDETGKGQSIVTLIGDLPIANMTVETESTNYTFTGTGIIGGTGGITKNGVGTLALLNTTNTYTGKTQINNGTLVIGNLNNAGFPSSIGASTSTNSSNIVFNNAKLRYIYSNDITTDRGLTLSGTNDTIDMATAGKTITLSGIIAGTGKLVKTGPGNLYITNNSNSFSGGTIIKQGNISINDPISTISMLGSGSVTFEGGTLSMGNVTSGWTDANMNFIVPEGYSGTINTDGRCSYRGTLTGGGTLNLYLPGTIDRTIFFGNWSAFTGKINVTCLASGSRFRLASSGYAGSEINLGANVTMYHGGSGTTGGDAVATSVSIGALSGVAGSYLADENWTIGAKNINTTFSGTISGNSIIKTGSGTLTLSGSNTYTGGTTINGGTLLITNTSGSGTGTGIVTVNSGILAGTGIINGAVTINNGGKIVPGNIFGSLTINNSVTLKSGSTVAVDVISSSGVSDKIIVTGAYKLIINGGILELTNHAATNYEAGNSFNIFSATDISGSFDSIVPSTPGDGLIWDTTQLRSNGIIKVAISTYSKNITENAEELSIYPNPTSDVINIKVSNKLPNATITIENINGQRKFEYSTDLLSTECINISHLPSGVYILKINYKGKLLFKKLYKK
jgi:autotransporter-associated beta strand protein